MPRKLLTDEERAERKRKSWDKILNGQRREGVTPGNPDDWINAFRSRFGFGDITFRGAISAAVTYFGLVSGFTLGDLKSAFKKKIRQVHPDYGGSDEESRKCLSYYDEL